MTPGDRPARPRILFVDDEAAILDGYRNVLRADRHRWEQRFAPGGAAALDLLAAAPADVVVSDMRMPGMDGLELLARVQERWPDTARIVLSGFADLQAASRASAVAHQYLMKPCDPEVLRAVIDRALELRAVLSGEAVRRAVGTIGALPTVPRLYRELSAALADPEVEVRRLARIVEEDVGMATRVLQFVNSAYFGLARRVTSIESAIVYAGVNTLRHLTLTFELARELGGAAGPPAGAEAVERHSILTARIARRIVADPGGAEAAFAAGLLHDAGKLVLASRLPGPFGEAVALAGRGRRQLAECEREILGADHAQVGAYLLGLWGLPRPIVEAVAFHHDEERLASGRLDLPVVIAAANQLAHLAAGEEAATAAAALDRTAWLDRVSADHRTAWTSIAAAEAGSARRQAGEGEGEGARRAMAGTRP